MAYFKIAESSGYQVKVELYEQAATDPGLSKDLILMGFKELKGVTSEQKYTPHLPYELQVPILDEGRFYLNRIRNYGKDKFKVKAYDPSSNLLGEWYVNTKFSKNNFNRTNQTLPLVCYDGITLLKTKDPVTTIQPVGKIVEELLHLTGITFDVIISSDLTHYKAGGQGGLLPNQYRCDPSVFIRNEDNPSAYDQLKAILRFFKWQVFQEDGNWRLLERESRDTTSLNVFNITQNTAATLDPSLSLQRSDLRSDPGEGYYDPLSSYRQEAFNGASSYKWQNPDFDKWDPDQTYPLYWDVNDPNEFNRINESGDVGFQVAGSGLFPDLMKQFPLYSLGFADTVTFRFKCTFDWESGLPTGQNYRVNLGRFILLKSGTGQDRGLNVSTGQFETTHDGVLFDEINTDSYTASKTFDYNFEVEIPILGNLLIELYFTGDTGLVVTKPKYFEAAFEGSKVADKPTRLVVSWSQSEPGQSIKEAFSATDPHDYVDVADFEYYDDTAGQWKDASGDWQDYNSDGFQDTIHEVIADQVVRSGKSFDHLLDLPIDFDKEVKLLNTIDYTLEGTQRTYVPHYIERNRLTRKARLKLIQIKSESSQDPQITFE